MVDEAKIRVWLQECGLPLSSGEVPNADYSVGFKMPSGLQMVVQRPKNRKDLVVVTCGINIEPAQKAKLQRQATEFLWTIRRDFLMKGVLFQFTPPDEGKIPDVVGIASEIYEDGLSKQAFMRGVYDVHNAVLVLILTIRRYIGD